MRHEFHELARIDPTLSLNVTELVAIRVPIAGAGAAGTVCGDENRGTNCMPLAQPSLSQIAAEINLEII